MSLPLIQLSFSEMFCFVKLRKCLTVWPPVEQIKPCATFLQIITHLISAFKLFLKWEV